MCAAEDVHPTILVLRQRAVNVLQGHLCLFVCVWVGVGVLHCVCKYRRWPEDRLMQPVRKFPFLQSAGSAGKIDQRNLRERW